MNRIGAAAVVLGLALGVVGSAEAAKKAKPVTATLYFHGTETVGEIDLVNNFGVAYNAMDTTEPSGAAPKSLQFTTWDGNPELWNDCAGSYLLPVWSGTVAGKVVGDLKVTLHTVSGPNDVTVQVWPDLTTQTCASNDVTQGKYPEPAAETTVALPPGPGATEVILENVSFKVVGRLTLMILPINPVPGRVLYDAPDYASSIEFSCVPKTGRSCTP